MQDNDTPAQTNPAAAAATPPPPPLVESGSANDAAAAFDTMHASGPRCWGPLQWRTLHQLLRGYPNAPTPAHETALREYTAALATLLPCSICATHWASLAPTVATTSRLAAMKWGVDVHNTVNKRLGKPLLSYAEAADAMRDACAATDGSQLSSASAKSQPTLPYNTLLVMLIIVAVIAVAVIVVLAVFCGRRAARGERF
jgi:hypothetical protein